MRPWIDGVAIDKEVAEETPCEECGAPMKYEPRYDHHVGDANEKPTYRAFAICTNPECGNEVEF